MKVYAKAKEEIHIPAEIEPYTKQSFITAGKDYEIHAIQIFKEIPFFQIVDDISYPAWLPYLLFDVIDTSMPSDWRCNFFPEKETGTLMAIGPDFVVKNETALCDMIELDADQVDRFWKRLDALNAEATDYGE